jgi:phthiocerol/phenolphthiocerol synthesis type-I polyketide synthase D
MLDAALQTLAAAMPAESLENSTEVTYLPVAIETLRVFGDVGRRARCRAELISVDDAGAVGRITLMDEEGTATAEVTGVYLRRVQRRTLPLPLAQKVFDTVWQQTATLSEIVAAQAPPPAGSWLLLTHDPDVNDIAEDFAAGFGSPTRRVITADLADESAVLEAFAKTAADPELPPLGVVVFVGPGEFDGTDADDGLAHARELIWAISAAVRAVVGGWHGKSPRLWLVTRNGLVVGGDESGDPAVGALKGLIRVLAYEHPDLRATLVDLDASGDAVARLTAELSRRTAMT